MSSFLSEKALLYSKQVDLTQHPLAAAASQLLHWSDFALKKASILLTLLKEDNCTHSLGREAYYQAIAEQVVLSSSIPLFSRALRQFRHRFLLRAVLRETASLTSTVETMKTWSDCADVIIVHTLRFCEQQLAKRYGWLQNAAGERVELLTIAMGKLGGQELNLSSDIDLIFVYGEAGNTTGPEFLGAGEYYNKLIQLFIQILQTITPDGFVFRVDLRLRPYGESGPLVVPLSTMDIYYQEQGREWERYAMVKARFVGTYSKSAEHWFLRLINPFVYRRYIDYSVIEALRGMKAMISREAKVNPIRNNIKNGPGGIREIEFIVQCLQLIRGGRSPAIQEQNTLKALSALVEAGLLPSIEPLQGCYLWLRRLENAIQFQSDQQTHALPEDPIQQQQLLQALAIPDWQALQNLLQQVQATVSTEFEAVLGIENDEKQEKNLLQKQLQTLWQGHLEEGRAVSLLRHAGFDEPEQCYQMLFHFKHSPRCRRLSQGARLRLDRFMGILLEQLSAQAQAKQVLLAAIRLLEQIVGRSAYVALLTENKTVLQELLHWFAVSPLITNLLIHHPFLLEVLLDEEPHGELMTLTALKHELKNRLHFCGDAEAEDEALRQFKLRCWLKAARAELSGKVSAVAASHFLSQVATVIIQKIIQLACQRLASRYPIKLIQAKLLILAYGKLGSLEMNYDSDVDLVFLHLAADHQEESVLTRLTQKMLHMLTTRTQTGILYAVDTRLRPSGSAGLLVSPLDAFADYQCHQAWTWEHQALLKARPLVGTNALTQRFYTIKHAVLQLPRDPDKLEQEVQAMRDKLGFAQQKNAIKYAPGGLIDLEFFIQYLILAHPAAVFVKETKPLKQLHWLAKQAVITAEQLASLCKAYEIYHRWLHSVCLTEP